jgi:hypothetical protein
MSLKPEDFSPTGSDWFSPTLEYVGRCKVEFSSPPGSVEGPATVSVDEAGDVTVEMVPEPGSLQTDDPTRYGLIGFFSGKEFAREVGGGVTRLDPSATNPCTNLEVMTPRGTFRTADVISYGTDSVLDTGEVRKATFAVGLSTFDAADAGDAEYWVLPLANFLSEFRQRPSDELYRHPLRIFPTPKVPDKITHIPVEHPDKEVLGERAKLSLYFAHSRDWLIRFEFGGGLGFVERLADYGESEQLLLKGKERHKTTAVMVGPTEDAPADTFERMREWFPFDVLSLLTLATGTEVGCPWVEIRDEDGRLVRRFHKFLGAKPFRKGRRLMEEIPMSAGDGIRATGRLIECACSRSNDLGETFVRIAIVHLVRAKYEDQTLDDQMSHLARGFETLCKRYRTIKEALGRNLGAAQREDVQDTLRTAADQIRGLKAAGGPGGAAALDRIAARVQSADQRDNMFGMAVMKLIKSFWLADAHILEDHYRTRPGGWAGLLSDYRGDVTHHGYLDILEAGHDVEEIVAVTYHLHDALARVVLKILRFDGGYKPGVIPQRMMPVRVNWVKPHYTAEILGYK